MQTLSISFSPSQTHTHSSTNSLSIYLSLPPTHRCTHASIHTRTHAQPHNSSGGGNKVLGAQARKKDFSPPKKIGDRNFSGLSRDPPPRKFRKLKKLTWDKTETFSKKTFFNLSKRQQKFFWFNWEKKQKREKGKRLLWFFFWQNVIFDKKLIRNGTMNNCWN